ncbi:MAG: hypothetical protein QM831_12580 [Kofleriaceae bacterium]
MLDALEHQVALEAAEKDKPTADDRRWSKEYGVHVKARLAELRRLHTPSEASIERAKPVRASTLTMTRDALLEAIARLTTAMDGTIQFAHRNLRSLSDNDLRRLYDSLETSGSDER